MVGESRKKTLEDVLGEEMIKEIVLKAMGKDLEELVQCDIMPAGDGLIGFLGDHFKAAITVRSGGKEVKIPLFIKSLPLDNKPKAELISNAHYFEREKLTFRLCDEIGGACGSNPWCSEAYVYTDSLVVMPDLSCQGYIQFPVLEPFDLPHTLLTVNSLARFHAATANYETKKNIFLGRPYSVLDEFGSAMTEPTFRDSPWLLGAAKLTTDFLKLFSMKYSDNVPNLKEKLIKLYIKACESMDVYSDTLNLLIHKDLWVSNVLFRYDKGAPTHALLIDFQLVRYAPPAFDLMIFLYLSTTRSFREQNEKYIFQYYYSTFMENVDEATKQRIALLKYDEEEFMRWCERARMFGLFQAVGTFPYVLMDPQTASETFDNPETYMKYFEDRTEPVVAHSRRCTVYRERQLEASEEFVERYVLNGLLN